jgi:outer membrane protein with beta-barrel domain
MDTRNFRIAMRVASVTAMFALATAAEAQHSSTHKPTTKASARPMAPDGRRTGFMLGVYTLAAPGVTLTGDDVDGTFKTNFGPGAGVMAGYAFNRTFSGYASVDVAKQGITDSDLAGNFGLRHIELGARANLPYGSATTVPYLTASYGRRALGARVTDDFEDSEYDMRLSGGMFGVGGGLEHVISPTLAVDGGLAVAFGRFSHGDIDGESSSLAVNGTTSIRLRIGMTWRPAPRRS